MLGKSEGAYRPLNPNGKDTQARFSDGKGHYTPERATLHREIVEHFLRGTKPVAHPTATVLGGGMAAGKSTLIKIENIGEENTVRIAVDDIRDMLPEFARDQNGNRPHNAMFSHEEASDISRELLEQAAKTKRNLVLDGLGDSTIEKLARKIDLMRQTGHRVLADYVTLPIDEAVRRSDAGARDPKSDRFGRMAPPTAIEYTHRAVAQVFPKAVSAGLFDRARVYDSRGKSPKLIATVVGKHITVLDPVLWKEFLARGQAGN